MTRQIARPSVLHVSPLNNTFFLLLLFYLRTSEGAVRRRST